MGGGAGIKITARMFGFYFTLRNKHATCGVESWDAHGYMDGMNNVRGDLLKATAHFELTAEEKKYVREKWGATSNEKLYCSRFTASGMVFAGWVRGRWQDAFPLTLKGYADFEFLGDKEITVEIAPADKNEFGNFWYDVFEFSADQDIVDDDGKPISIETQYEWHEDDNQVNYGYAQASA